MSNRFAYVHFDQMRAERQTRFLKLVGELEAEIGLLPQTRAGSIALTKLEETYMWIGKALRDNQLDEQSDQPNLPGTLCSCGASIPGTDIRCDRCSRNSRGEDMSACQLCKKEQDCVDIQMAGTDEFTAAVCERCLKELGMWYSVEDKGMAIMRDWMMSGAGGNGPDAFEAFCWFWNTGFADAMSPNASQQEIIERILGAKLKVNVSFDLEVQR